LANGCYEAYIKDESMKHILFIKPAGLTEYMQGMELITPWCHLEQLPETIQSGPVSGFLSGLVTTEKPYEHYFSEGVASCTRVQATN
jgi:hypothetical protein